MKAFIVGFLVVTLNVFILLGGFELAFWVIDRYHPNHLGGIGIIALTLGILGGQIIYYLKDE